MRKFLLCGAMALAAAIGGASVPIDDAWAKPGWNGGGGVPPGFHSPGLRKGWAGSRPPGWSRSRGQKKGWDRGRGRRNMPPGLR